MAKQNYLPGSLIYFDGILEECEKDEQWESSEIEIKEKLPPITHDLWVINIRDKLKED